MVSPSQSQVVRDYDPRDPPRFGEWVRVQGVSFPAIEMDDAPTQPNGAPMPAEFFSPPVQELSPNFQPEYEREIPSAETEIPSPTPQATESSFTSQEQADDRRLNATNQRVHKQRLVAGVLLAGLLLLIVIVYRGNRRDLARESLGTSSNSITSGASRILTSPNFTSSFPAKDWRWVKNVSSVPSVINSRSWYFKPNSTEKFTVFHFMLSEQSFSDSNALKSFLVQHFIESDKSRTKLIKIEANEENDESNVTIFEVKPASRNRSKASNRVRFLVREEPHFEIWKLVASAPSDKLDSPRVQKFFNSFKPINVSDRSTPAQSTPGVTP